MSPYEIVVSQSKGNMVIEFVLSAKLSNRDKLATNCYNIEIRNKGTVYGKKFVTDGYIVGQYRCVKQLSGYTVTRITGGDMYRVSVNNKKLVDCQMSALHDYCILNNLTPIKEIKEIEV